MLLPISDCLFTDLLSNSCASMVRSRTSSLHSVKLTDCTTMICPVASQTDTFKWPYLIFWSFFVLCIPLPFLYHKNQHTFNQTQDFFESISFLFFYLMKKIPDSNNPEIKKSQNFASLGPNSLFEKDRFFKRVFFQVIITLFIYKNSFDNLVSLVSEKDTKAHAKTRKYYYWIYLMEHDQKCINRTHIHELLSIKEIRYFSSRNRLKTTRTVSQY